MFPKTKLGNLLDSMAAPAKTRETQEALTAQAISEIEQGLGDVGRGADFPMSRTRGGSTSSKGSGGNMLSPPTRPPPLPPIPAEHRRLPRLPDGPAGDTLTVPKTRRSRSRGASAPGSSRQPGSLAPIDEDHWDYAQMPLPPLPATTPSPEPVRERSVSPWWEDKEPQQEAAQETGDFQGGGQAQEDILAAQRHQEVARQLSQPMAVRPRPVHSSSTPAPPTQARPAPKYSLFPAARSLPVSPIPPRFVPLAFTTPSDGSRSSSPGFSNEVPRPGLLRDLEPNNPYGYPEPPPFFHNWDPPNRPRARHSVNPTLAHRAGPLGPPIGSRPRPPPPPALTLQPPSARNSIDPPPARNPIDLHPLRNPNAAATAWNPNAATAWSPNAAATGPAAARYSVAAAAATGQFTYYPMMSPYEAEASLGGAGAAAAVREGDGYGADGCGNGYGDEYGNWNGGNGSGDGYGGNGYGRNGYGGNGSGSGSGADGQDATRMFPMLDHDLLSAQQAAAVAANRGVVDAEFGAGAGRNNNRSSSCYGDEDEAQDVGKGKEREVEKGGI